MWKAVFGELFHQLICEQFALSEPFVGTIIMTCSIIVFCVVNLAGIPWFIMAWDSKKSIYIGFSTLRVAHVSKFLPKALNYGTLHNTYTDAHHTLHYTNTKYQSSYTDILPVSKNTRSYERN